MLDVRGLPEERGSEKSIREHVPQPICLSRASLGLSETLPSLDALPLGSFSEPAPLDCTVIILDTGLRAESVPLSSAASNLIVYSVHCMHYKNV